MLSTSEHTLAHLVFACADAEKACESRLRRLARRHGLTLHRSRCGTPEHPDFGGYMIIDPERNAVVAGGSPFAFCMSLDDVKTFLGGWSS